MTYKEALTQLDELLTAERQALVDVKLALPQGLRAIGERTQTVREPRHSPELVVCFIRERQFPDSPGPLGRSVPKGCLVVLNVNVIEGTGAVF